MKTDPLTQFDNDVTTDDDFQDDVRDNEQKSLPPEADLFFILKNEFATLAEQARLLIQLQVDSAKDTAASFFLKAALIAVAATVGLAMIFVSVSLLLTGLSGGLSLVLGQRVWLANVIVSSVVFLSVAIGLRLAVKKFRLAQVQRTVEKYARETKH
jgi:hypothetical protein